MGRGGEALPAPVDAHKEDVAVKEAVEPARRISLKELEAHNTQKDCWIAICGKVYDVTLWLEKHPGGKLPILDLAGQDATDAFLAFHAAKVEKMLPKFYVGDLEPLQVSPLTADYRKLAKDIRESSLFETNLWFYYKQVCVLGFFFCLVVAGVVLSKSTIVHMGCALLLGFLWNICSFIGHDTGHNGITKNRKIDTYIGLLFGNTITGIGIGWWKRTHNVHHIVCNSVEYDPDIQHVPVFAISKEFFTSPYSLYHFRDMTFDVAARFLVSYQHWTFYPIMAVARINLHLQSLLLLFSDKDLPSRGKEFFCFGLFWLWFGSLLSALPSIGERAGFLFLCLAMSGMLHVQICISHFSMATFRGRPENDEFARTQLLTTQDVSCHPWVDWFHGGLQFQIEHHLFPRMPRHNLRLVMPMVKALCKRHDIPYISVSFLESNKRLIAALREAAMEARTIPRPASLLSSSVLLDGLFCRG